MDKEVRDDGLFSFYPKPNSPISFVNPNAATHVVAKPKVSIPNPNLAKHSSNPNGAANLSHENIFCLIL